MSWVILFTLFIFGLLIGSFLNVLALRYKEGGKILTSDIVKGRSHCPNCRKTLEWYELVPLFSFLIQRGRCRSCGVKLSWQYPIVEFLTGAFFALAYWRLSAGGPELLRGTDIWLLAIWLFAMALLILMSLIDFRLFVIPDQINILIGLLGVGMILIGANSLVSYFLGAAIGFIFFGAIILVSRGRGMGLGDLKLAAALGFFLGWPNAVVGFLLAFIIGSLVAVPLLISGKKGRKDALPFGPFLATGALIALFFGDAIIGWYLHLLMV